MPAAHTNIQHNTWSDNACRCRTNTGCLPQALTRNGPGATWLRAHSGKEVIIFNCSIVRATLRGNQTPSIVTFILTTTTWASGFLAVLPLGAHNNLLHYRRRCTTRGLVLRYRLMDSHPTVTPASTSSISRARFAVHLRNAGMPVFGSVHSRQPAHIRKPRGNHTGIVSV